MAQPLTHHLLPQEIFLQRSLPHRIILQRDIPICAECTREHSDVPKHGLERLIKDIGHLVLEVLRSHYIVRLVKAAVAGTNITTHPKG